ncbi:MAG: methyltransferase [Bacillota bacterium]|nr:methyltransferase [Bacillota bacterium]
MEGSISNERIDDIGFSGYRLVQNPEWFCYGIDAVLIANFAALKKNAAAADLGTGTGIIPLILKHKYSPAVIYGVEVQPEVAALAKKTVGLNGLEEEIKIINATVRDASDIIGKNCLDAVVTNPPYVGGGEGIHGSHPVKAAARHEIEGSLEDFIKCAFELLKDGGDFYMINRPSRLADVVFLCRKYRLEPKHMQFIQPSEGKKPNIFMIHCVKYGKPELKFLDPICVYEKSGGYTEEILKIYER